MWHIPRKTTYHKIDPPSLIFFIKDICLHFKLKPWCVGGTLKHKIKF